MNLNKLFRSLPIGAKLTIAFAAWVVVPVGVLGLAGTLATMRQIERTALDVLQRDLLVARERSQALLSRVRSDLAYFAAENRLAELTARPDRTDLTGLGSALESFLRHKPEYYRLHVLATSGRLLVRAAADPDGRVSVDLAPDPAEGLYYRYLADRTAPGSVAVQPVEVRGGADGSPIAAIALVQPLATDGRVTGAAVLELRVGELADLFRATGIVQRGVTAVTTTDGFLLYHSVRHSEHRTLLAPLPEATVYADLPREVADRVLGGAPGVDRSSRSVIAYLPFRFAGHEAAEQFVLYHVVPKSQLFRPARRFAAITLVGGTAFLALALWLAVVAARQFTRPIRELREGTKRLARGVFEPPLAIATNDELEELGADFTRMAHQLRLHTENLESLVAQRTREKLRAERLAAVGTLAAGVAHEINNPTGVILNRIECVLQEIEERCAGCFALRDLDVIRQHASRVASIARGLLDLSRLDTDGRVGVNLADVIARIAGFVAPEFRAKGVSLEVGGEATSAPVRGNESRLEQLALNLVLNALQATPDGGRVRLGVEANDAQRVVLVVADTGCGIASENLEQIFEPFYSSRHEAGGTGLGLAVAHNIATAHGAEISVRSRQGEGTTFRVAFPRDGGAILE